MACCAEPEGRLVFSMSVVSEHPRVVLQRKKYLPMPLCTQPLRLLSLQQEDC